MAFSGFDTNALQPTPLRAANPLEMAGQAAAIKNALLENRVRQSEYDARVAQGNALLGATGADGQVDYAKARAAMAADPTAAYGAVDAYRQQNASRTDDLSNQEAQLAYQTHTRDAAAGAFIRLASNPTDANIRGTASFMAALTPNAAKQIHWTANNIMALPSAEQRAEAIKQLATTSLPGHERISQAFGTPTSVDDGQTIQTGTQAAGMDGGAFTPAAGVQRKTSPEFNQTYTDRTIMTPNGPMRVPMTNAQFQAYQGVQGGFTGRRIDTAGGNSTGAPNVPAGAVPAGAEDQAKTGLAVRNHLSGQQADLTENITTLRNIDTLLTKLPKDLRSRTLKDIANNIDRLNITGLNSRDYATISQEIDKAGATLRQQMMDDGGGPHTNAGLAETAHITPSLDMTMTAARALSNERLSTALHRQRRYQVAQSVQDPSRVMGALADYDQNFDPRFGTIQRLGPEEGREYAKTHIGNPAQYAASVYRMAKASRDKGYDYGMTPQQIDRIISSYEGKRGR